MQDNELIEQYRDKPALFHLINGDEVVGTSVIDDNKLLYIIRSGQEYRVSPALQERASTILSTKPVQSTTKIMVFPSDN